jgi:hypothetical protein
MPIINGTEIEPAAIDTNTVKEWKTRELDARVQI